MITMTLAEFLNKGNPNNLSELIKTKPSYNRSIYRELIIAELNLELHKPIVLDDVIGSNESLVIVSKFIYRSIICKFTDKYKTANIIKSLVIDSLEVILSGTTPGNTDKIDHLLWLISNFFLMEFNLHKYADLITYCENNSEVLKIEADYKLSAMDYLGLLSFMTFLKSVRPNLQQVLEVVPELYRLREDHPTVLKTIPKNDVKLTDTTTKSARGLVPVDDTELGLVVWHDIAIPELSIPCNEAKCIIINDDIRIYYDDRSPEDADIKNGFDFVVLQNDGNDGEITIAKGDWIWEHTYVQVLFRGIAYYDGVRHLYMGLEQTDNEGYLFYPKTEHFSKIFEALEKLIQEHCSQP